MSVGQAEGDPISLKSGLSIIVNSVTISILFIDVIMIVTYNLNCTEVNHTVM